MKIVILSTYTLHHRYFISKICALFNVVSVFYEEGEPFKACSMEEEYEIKTFRFSEPNILTHNINTVNEVSDIIMSCKADLALVFGCRKIAPLLPIRMINVHRGILPNYRGLDSDLWAIYNDDFENIGVTLHEINEGLDTGKVLATERFKFSPRDKIYHLRYRTTLLATEMMIRLLSSKYYSRMPEDKKVICEKKFEEHVKEL